MSMYDACSIDKEETIDNLDNNGQLDILTIWVGREHAAYLDYKFTETEIKKVVSAVEETLPKSRKHTADFQVLMWWNCLALIYSQWLPVYPVHTVCIGVEGKIREQRLWCKQHADKKNATTCVPT